MNDIQVLTPLIQKGTEGVQVYQFRLIRDQAEITPDSNHQYEASFATQKNLVKIVPATVNNGIVQFDSSQLADLERGVYRLEIWEMIDDQVHAIYPANRMLTFTNKLNTRDLPAHGTL